MRFEMKAALFATLFALSSASATAQQPVSAPTPDPRVGLGAGWMDAKQAASNVELLASRPRPELFFNAANIGDFGFLNGDLAFSGNHAFLGGYAGVQIWDITNHSAPVLTTTIPCPGGQGDVSVHGNLLFVSVEETKGRVDCGRQGVTDSVSSDRFRGVRIYDISNIAMPKQVAAVQTCRGSHTHTLVPDPRDPSTMYVYVSGTSPVRPAAELAGCSGGAPDVDPNTAYFRIEIIKVPLATPADARVVNSPRIFADSAGNIAGLAKQGDHGPNTQTTSETNQCHDITAYPEMGLAAGACSGNGILLDISDPANPKRIAEVSDPNFAYWHSATFSNDGRKVLFSDEWGGGTAPRCQATDRPQWGADAIFSIGADRRLTQAGYYKLPAAQTATENCVAHNGSLIPVPGRDIMVQAWYQGGMSIFDFTDAAHPKEIASFDRGPMSATELHTGGYWSTYWYDGHIFGSEIGRGFDVFALKPSEHLSQNEIDAARSVKMTGFNPQLQTKLVWPASFAVARSYLDQLVRDEGIVTARSTKIAADLMAAEKLTGTRRRSALTRLATALETDARTAKDGARVRMLAGAVRELAAKG